MTPIWEMSRAELSDEKARVLCALTRAQSLGHQETRLMEELMAVKAELARRASHADNGRNR